MNLFKILFIILIFSQFLASSDIPATNEPVAGDEPSDYLAADTEAARYRTNKIDSAIALIPAHIKNNVFSDPHTYLRELVLFLKEEAVNDYHVVKRIHDWIVDSIAYEFVANVNLWEFLGTQRTNCTGYADLFREMASYAGIRADVVFGYSRTYLFPDGTQGNHAWNVVFINGKQYLVDTTHDARQRVRNGRIGEKKPYSDNELFINPRHKILFNYPFDNSYQLLDPPLSYEEFMKAPRIRLPFLKFGLAFADPHFSETIFTVSAPISNTTITRLIDAIETKGKVGQLTLQSSVNVEIKAILTDTDDINSTVSYKEHVRVIRKGKQVLILFSAPDKGAYRLKIEARFYGKEDWENVYNLIVVENAGKDPGAM